MSIAKNTGVELPELNMDLLLKTVGRILLDVDHFDMGSFGTKTACGTEACLAGTALIIAEKEADDPDKLKIDWSFTGSMVSVWMDGNYKVLSVAGAEVLGLTEHEADLLFFWGGQTRVPDAVSLIHRVSRLIKARAKGNEYLGLKYQRSEVTG